MSIPASVLARWSRFAQATVRPFGTGLINKTFLVECAGVSAVFQRLHPVFAASVATPVIWVFDDEQFALVEAVFSRNHVATPAARDRHEQT